MVWKKAHRYYTFLHACTCVLMFSACILIIITIVEKVWSSMFFIFLWKPMIQVYTVVHTNVGVQLKVKLIDII